MFDAPHNIIHTHNPPCTPGLFPQKIVLLPSVTTVTVTMSKIKDKAHFIFRTFVFVLIMDCIATSINLVQYPALVLRLLSRHLYRKYIQYTQALFGSLLVLLTYLFTPVEIVVTGDHEGLNKDAMAVIMVCSCTLSH